MQAELTSTDQRRLEEIEATPHATWSLDDWVLKHYSIYGGNNKDKAAMELWLQVVTEGARLAENVRRGKITEALDENLADLFGWLCAFVGKYVHQPTFPREDPIGSSLRDGLRVDGAVPGPESFAKWILQKYPGVCPACGNRRCICSSHRRIFEERKDTHYAKEINALIKRGSALRTKALTRFAKSKRERAKFYRLPLDNLIDEFIFIYGGGHEGVDLWQIAAHLLEEIGEAADEIAFLSELSHLQTLLTTEQPPIRFKEVVEKAYKREGSLQRLYDDMRQMKTGGEHKIIQRLRSQSVQTLREELADVFSWLSAILSKIGDIMREVRDEPKAWYAFRDWLEKKFFINGAFVCLACGSGPCQNDCRAVWHVRKVFRDLKRKN